MTEQMAQAIVIIVASVGACAWFCAMLCLRRFRLLAETVRRETLLKNVSLDQAMRAVLKLVAASPSVHITNRLENAVSFRLLHMEIAARFSSDRGGVRVETLVDPARLMNGFRMAMSVLVCIVGPLAIVGGATLAWTLIAPAQNLAIRWQVFQVIHIVHFLWPPFLIYAIANKHRAAGMHFADKLLLQAELGDA